MANPRRVLLVGSIPLKSAAEVFAAVGKTLGGLVPRIPDGETGERINWIMFQADKNCDPGAKPLVQLGDLGFSVEMANRLMAAINRPIGWIHMPVPIDRDDDAYFAPLKNLALKPGTELYLGLVHFRDGLEGAARRIAAARKISPVDFGILFECGFGRRPPDEPIAKFLELHREIATGV